MLLDQKHENCIVNKRVSVELIDLTSSLETLSQMEMFGNVRTFLENCWKIVEKSKSRKISVKTKV